MYIYSALSVFIGWERKEHLDILDNYIILHSLELSRTGNHKYG